MGGIIGGVRGQPNPTKNSRKISTDSPQNHDIQVTGGSFRGVFAQKTKSFPQVIESHSSENHLYTHHNGWERQQNRRRMEQGCGKNTGRPTGTQSKVESRELNKRYGCHLRVGLKLQVTTLMLWSRGLQPTFWTDSIS